MSDTPKYPQRYAIDWPRTCRTADDNGRYMLAAEVIAAMDEQQRVIGGLRNDLANIPQTSMHNVWKCDCRACKHWRERQGATVIRQQENGDDVA